MLTGDENIVDIDFPGGLEHPRPDEIPLQPVATRT